MRSLVVPEPIQTESAEDVVKRVLTGAGVLGSKDAALKAGEGGGKENMYQERPGTKRGKRPTEKQIQEEQKKVMLLCHDASSSKEASLPLSGGC